MKLWEKKKNKDIQIFVNYSKNWTVTNDKLKTMDYTGFHITTETERKQSKFCRQYFKFIFLNEIIEFSFKFYSNLFPKSLTEDMSEVVLVIAEVSEQGDSHFLNQCWPSSMSNMFMASIFDNWVSYCKWQTHYQMHHLTITAQHNILWIR